MTPALVLCGGKATRMNGALKCLLPLGDGKPILDHLLNDLLRADLHPVILGPSEIVEHPEIADYNLVALPDSSPQGGTARAIHGAAKFLNHRKSDPILVCYGDTWLPGFDYGAAAAYPKTLTVGWRFSGGNVELGPAGVQYSAILGLPRPNWLELGATCFRHEDFPSIGALATTGRDFDVWLQVSNPWDRVCFHDGLVLTTGDPASYEVAKQWRPR